MHELSVALSILDIAERECRDGGYTSVAAIRVRVGRGGGILPEALDFAFEAVKANTLAHKARFLIEVVPIGGFCSACGREFETEETFLFACPHCASPSFQIHKGYELQVVELEVN